ncbi:hypothetical protein R3W88_001166 [Solanum pinnatisectum]|uniref:Uncharacterized protein n=1 Tax=Solanum pinnatisectum TaxID=50273 RepID=A0AAV9MHR0_9SOLN|nr:hypothetical protein R3W88_001166 [Solanum pinnatisectum]
MHEEANSMQKMNKRPASETLSKEAQSSNFSFGIKGNSMSITPIPIPCIMQDTNQDKSMEKFGHDQYNQGHKGKEGHKDQNKDTNQQGGTSGLHQDNNRANIDYQNNFSRISNNYARYDPNLQRNRNVDNQVNNNVDQDTKIIQVQDNGKSETITSSQAQQQLAQRRDHRPDETRRQAQGKNHPTCQQQEPIPHIQTQQEQELGDQEEHWQTQKKETKQK